MNGRDQSLRKARRSNREVDWSTYKRLRNYCTNAIRSAKGDYHKQLMNENINNPRNFWKSIKTVIPNKSNLAGTKSIPFLKDDITELEDSECANKSNIFCSHLKHQSFKMTNLVWRKLRSKPIRTVNKFKFGYISKLWVEKQLKSLKRHKATGLDNLPA